MAKCLDRNGILLVEDNPDDVALALRALRKNGIEQDVEVAVDGPDALERLFNRVNDGELPYVVLLDLKLPGVDGLEVLRRIRGDERTRLLPVVILTSSTEEQDLMEGYGRGANSYIRKPVDFPSFIDAIGQFGRYWLGLNEPPPRYCG